MDEKRRKSIQDVEPVEFVKPESWERVEELIVYLLEESDGSELGSTVWEHVQCGGYFEDEFRNAIERLEKEGKIETEYGKWGRRHYALKKDSS